jgi:NADH-quinone oxidoreductase subunit N
MLIMVGVITVACGFYYYFKVVRAMYWEAPTAEGPVPVSGVSRVTMCAMMAAIIFLGIYPQPILDALR